MMKRLFILLVFTILFIGGCTINTTEKECPTTECEECPEEKALMLSEFTDIFVNEYNEDEYLWTYYLYNFGYKEAKNVEIECVMEDLNYNIIYSKNENIGNIASTSSKYEEMTTPIPNNINDNDEYYWSCSIKSCENCDILMDRI